MKYNIDREVAQKHADMWYRQENVGSIVGLIGMSIACLGLTGAILLKVFNVMLMPTPCFGALLLGVIIAGIGGAIIGVKPISVAFLEAEKEGKILEVRCKAKDNNANLLVVSVIIETESGKCECRELGLANKCVHTKYANQTIDLNHACLYIPYADVASS